MFCSKCGAEIDDSAVVCPKCGCATANYDLTKEREAEEDDKTTTGMVVLSIILPIVGVILGIVNLCKKKSKSGTTYLIIGIVSWIVWGIIFASL